MRRFTIILVMLLISLFITTAAFAHSSNYFNTGGNSYSGWTSNGLSGHYWSGDWDGNVVVVRGAYDDDRYFDFDYDNDRWYHNDRYGYVMYDYNHNGEWLYYLDDNGNRHYFYSDPDRDGKWIRYYDKDGEVQYYYKNSNYVIIKK